MRLVSHTVIQIVLFLILFSHSSFGLIIENVSQDVCRALAVRVTQFAEPGADGLMGIIYKEGVFLNSQL